MSGAAMRAMEKVSALDGPSVAEQKAIEEQQKAQEEAEKNNQNKKKDEFFMAKVRTIKYTTEESKKGLSVIQEQMKQKTEERKRLKALQEAEEASGLPPGALGINIAGKRASSKDDINIADMARKFATVLRVKDAFINQRKRNIVVLTFLDEATSDLHVVSAEKGKIVDAVTAALKASDKTKDKDWKLDADTEKMIKDTVNMKIQVEHRHRARYAFLQNRKLLREAGMKVQKDGTLVNQHGRVIDANNVDAELMTAMSG